MLKTKIRLIDMRRLILDFKIHSLTAISTDRRGGLKPSRWQRFVIKASIYETTHRTNAPWMLLPRLQSRHQRGTII